MVNKASHMKILVTGCNGQLGKELRRLLEAEMPGKTVFSDIDTLDITDAAATAAFVSAGGFTHIVNCAAYTSVDRAEEDTLMCTRINADAVMNIAKAAESIGAKVIHISTDYVFDGHSWRPYREGDTVNPRSCYGSTKRKGETLLLSLCPDAVIVRTSWLYSALGANNFVKTMIRLGNEKQQIKVVYDQIGTPTCATDLARMIFTILTSPKWLPGVYHYSNEGVCSWYDFAKAVHRLAGIKGCRITPVTTADYPTAAERPPFSVLDKEKIKVSYGVEIPHWEESLSRCIAEIQSETPGEMTV